MNKTVQLTYDIAVIGGGPGGIPAAIAAARMGKQVILVERNSFLGGAAASGLGILGYLDREGNQALGGIAQEMIDRLAGYGGAEGHYICPVHNSITPISSELFKIVALEMCMEAGVKVLFQQELLDVTVKNGCITHVSIFGKCTKTEIEAEVFIDGTGDGDLAYMAGVKYVTGQDDTGINQPCTLMFTIGNFDLDELFKYIEENPDDFGIKEQYAHGYNLEFFRKTKGHCFIGLQKLIENARLRGELHVPRNQFIYITTPARDLLAVNTTRITEIDASDPYELSEGLINGYKQITELMQFLNKYVPGFEHAFLAHISPALGVRETRHFEGKKRLKVNEIYEENNRSHAIGLCAYNMDIHSGIDESINLTVVEKAFGIPYECMVPRNIDGLLLSGRTISVDSMVYAAVRVMGPCLAIGEAAGAAAALAIEQEKNVADLDVQELRLILKQNGVLL